MQEDYQNWVIFLIYIFKGLLECKFYGFIIFGCDGSKHQKYKRTGVLWKYKEEFWGLFTNFKEHGNQVKVFTF